MHFCEKCDNMFYLKLHDNENELLYYCRKCGNETDMPEKSYTVMKKYIQKNTMSKKNIVNEYTKFDPTLPHIYSMPCADKECRVKNPQYDSIYVRYNTESLKYIYICTYCDATWNNNDNTNVTDSV